ncbi:phage tail fiber protein [Bosea sp. RCC_152_1]|uniref:phage tail fiber domain-containing protein n=1 Tax=Bosea sp. RCC_152_1 TaxID=3239228 RepID=UPI0035253AE9
MALSYAQFPGDGVTPTFAVPFPYLAKGHVSVRVNLVPVSFTWDDGQTVRISPGYEPGVVEVRRTTPRETPMVDFQDGSVLVETDLDLSALQTFYIVQEAIDIAGGTLELKADGSYGAAGRRISDIGDPTSPRDAVTKQYHDGTFLPQMNALLAAAVVARDGSVTARQAAEAALAAAVAARDLALQYRDTTKGYRDEVAAWNTNVNAKSANVDAKSANVDTKASTVDTQSAQVASDRTATQGFRNEAETFKNAAAASADRAATFDPSSYYSKTEINGTVSGLNTSIGAASTAASNANANANARVSKAGDTMSGDLTIYKVYPMVHLVYPNVFHWRIYTDSNARLYINNGDNGSGGISIGPGGDVNTAQLGDLYTFVANARNGAYNDAYNNIMPSVSDRVHRVRMVGYGEIGGTGGMSNCAPGVFTGAAGTPYGAQTFGYRTLQQHIPSQGGYVNVYVE